MMEDETANQTIPGVNQPGRFFVDETCTDCGLCPDHAPETFRRDDELGHSYVFAQPSSEDELELALGARELCPTESIGERSSAAQGLVDGER